MMHYDEAYEVVVHLAKAKMIMNAHKGNIEDLEVGDLIAAAKDEINELDWELNGKVDPIKAIEEAADVLNFMIAAVQKSINQYRGRKNDKDTGHNEGGAHKTLEHSGHHPHTDSSGAPIFGGDDSEDCFRET